MASVSICAPTEEQLSEAVAQRNATLIAQYALALDIQRRALRAALPDRIEAASNAKRDLDVCRAAIKNHDQTISMLQSLLREARAF